MYLYDVSGYMINFLYEKAKPTLLPRIVQRSKKETTTCYQHHRVPHLKGACHREKYASSFHEMTYYCCSQLRILGSTRSGVESVPL